MIRKSMKFICFCLFILILSFILSACKEKETIADNNDKYNTNYNEDYQTFNGSLISTPNSTCFSEIGYDSNSEILKVRFRDSGSAYLYYDFPEYEWLNFKDADSLGGYYNKNIKGIYGPAERLD